MRAPSFSAAVIAAILAASAASAVTACSPAPSGRTTPVAADPTVTIPRETKLIQAPITEPEDLPGVDTSALNARERRAFWQWASQLYAPCPEVAVSIATCVKEDRACSACVPAARFLAARARMGAAQNEAIAAFTVRFGRDVKKVDLADSPVRGPESAPVTVIVWSDFECPACGFAVPLLDEILEEHPEDVRLVHKLYPLNLHPHARPAARAALAAKNQGKYWAMEKLLFANQGRLEDQDLEEHAVAAGLDLKKYKRDIADPKAEEIIERDREEADKQGLNGTPFILINGREFDLGFFRLDRDLKVWIESEIEIRRTDALRRAVAAPAAP